MKIELIGRSIKNSDGLIESNGSIVIETEIIEEVDEIKDSLLDMLKLVNEKPIFENQSSYKHMDGDSNPFKWNTSSKKVTY